MKRFAEFELAHTYQGVPFEQRLPLRATLLTYLTERAATDGDAPFVTAVSAEGHATTLSYQELDVCSRRWARWLRNRFQPRPGAVFALLPANEAASVVAVFGLLRSGCAILLLNPAHPAARLQQQAEALGAQEILRASAVPADLLPQAIPAPDLSALEDAPITDPDPPVDPMADALFFGTSGSTAISKLVVQSHYNAAVNAEAVRRHHRLQRGDRILGCLPIFHVNGLHFTLFATLAAGAHAVLVHGFDPFGYPKLIEEFRPKVASVVPSILEALLGTWRRPSIPGDFGYFVSAAAPLAARTARAVHQKLGARILQGYGLTETNNFSTTMPADLSVAAYRRLALEADIPSIGTALYGNEVAVLTPEGTRAAPGEIGEICMRGHNVMMGYAGNDAATREAFQGGWFHSQDLGFEILDPESGRSFLTITGRIKNIAKVGGEAVSLDEMDRVLLALPQIRDAACVARPHRMLGEEIIAAVVLEPVDQPADSLFAHLKAVFSSTVLPRRIVRLAAIPRTATGKVLRAELAQQLASLEEEAAP